MVCPRSSPPFSTSLLASWVGSSSSHSTRWARRVDYCATLRTLQLPARMDLDREKFCNVCESANDLFGSGLILNKYNVKFFRCSYCGFIQTEAPYWLEEAYSTPIASSDIGYVSRN